MNPLRVSFRSISAREVDIWARSGAWRSQYRRGSFKEWVGGIWMEVDVMVDETVESALGAREFR